MKTCTTKTYDKWYNRCSASWATFGGSMKIPEGLTFKLYDVPPK